MASLRTSFSGIARLAAAGAILLPLIAAPAIFLSVAASAGDEDPDTGFRFYLAIPFIATADPQPARFGFQVLAEIDDETTHAPLDPGPGMDTALDLGFTRQGLAKFDVIGTDARSAYDSFARAIGLTPEEVELCRHSDCLDWVKSGEQVFVPATPLGQD